MTLTYSDIHKDKMIYLFTQRGMPSHIVNYLPHHGVIVIEDDYPIGAGFIRLLEGTFGVLDSFITNPNCSWETKNKATDEILITLTSMATNYGLTNFFAFTRSKSLIKKARNHGFQLEEDMQMISLSIDGRTGICHF